MSLSWILLPCFPGRVSWYAPMMHKRHAQQQLGEEQRRCEKHIFDPKLPNRYRSLASIFLGSYPEQLPPKLEVLTKILS